MLKAVFMVSSLVQVVLLIISISNLHTISLKTIVTQVVSISLVLAVQSLKRRNNSTRVLKSLSNLTSKLLLSSVVMIQTQMLLFLLNTTSKSMLAFKLSDVQRQSMVI